MAQIKKTCSVTNGSQTVAITGDLSARIKRNHVFMVDGELVPYVVAQDSTYDGLRTTVLLTGAYAGTTNGAAPGVFATDATYPDMIPTIAQGDVGTAAVFTQAMYRVQDMVKSVSPTGLGQYTDYWNDVKTWRDQVQTNATTAQTASVAAATSASTASAAATTATTNAGAATTSASSAASSLAQANAARDAALDAWRASTAPAEQLAGISAAFHQGSVVDAFLYDTAKDSDGGAWRARCKTTSWENETLATGKWLGYQANMAAALAAGGVPGDYFQNGADSNTFYMLVSNNIVQIFRGNKREFPAVALIVVESARVVIYDATQPSLPMWMVFVDTGSAGAIGWSSGNTVGTKAVTAINGVLAIVGDSGGILADFAKDDIRCVYNAAYYLTSDRRLSSRNATCSFSTGGDGVVVASYIIYDVAAAVLPDAPLDYATGLPVPTIAFATNGGVSVFKQDGAVGHWMNNVGWVRLIAIDSRGWLFAAGGDSIAYKAWYKYSLPTGTDNTIDGLYSQGSIPTRPGTDASTGNVCALAGTRSYKALGLWSFGLALYRENPATPAKSMVALISNAYNTGWQVGDSRGAWLADTVAEVATGAELVTNGTFETNTAAWTASNATLSIDTSRLKVSNTAATNGYAYQTIATLVGKTYRITLDFDRSSSTTTVFLYVGTGAGGNDNGYASSTAATGTITLTFVASAATTYLNLINDFTSGHFGYFDNVSVRLIEPDRSVKANGLTVNGSITKAAVATGSQLMGYSGFSTSNYLEQPYSANTDFGAGDFCVMGWAKPNGAGGWMFSRCASDESLAIQVLQVSATDFRMRCYGSGGSALDGAISTPPASGTWSFFTLVRENGVVKSYLNGVLIGTSAFTVNMSTSLTTTLGCRRTGGIINAPFDGSLALWRVGTTAPNADQVAQIYRDELSLFQAGARCTIDGTGNQIMALAYDDATDTLHVGTTWGRSAFKGLARYESSATSVGAVRALAAGYGAYVTGGDTAARFYQPGLVLRDELRRRDSLQRASQQDVKPLWFTGDGATTAFTLVPGVEPQFVYRQGLMMRDQGNDYTATYDGYRWTVTFVTAPGASANICIMGVKNV